MDYLSPRDFVNTAGIILFMFYFNRCYSRLVGWNMRAVMPVAIGLMAIFGAGIMARAETTIAANTSGLAGLGMMYGVIMLFLKPNDADVTATNGTKG